MDLSLEGRTLAKTLAKSRAVGREKRWCYLGNKHMVLGRGTYTCLSSPPSQAETFLHPCIPRGGIFSFFHLPS